MLLSEIFKGAPDIEITGLSIDSRKVQKGDLFFCLKGLETDGHKYVKSACDNGAAAICHMDEIPDKQEDVYFIKVDDTKAELNRVSDLFFGKPSSKLEVFGITGTNGKTTIANIIKDVYSAYKPCGYMGTVGTKIGNSHFVPTLTTPDSVEMHKTLKAMVDAGLQAAAIEVSSQGLHMNRVDSVKFDVAIFTNLTYDHLDYHHTMEEYFKAKQILFKMLTEDNLAILNVDDVSFETLKEITKAKVVTYGIKKSADYMAKDLKLSVKGSEFTLVHNEKEYTVKTNLPAEYNVYNILAAVAAMSERGMCLDQIVPALADLDYIEGRMEIIDEGQDFTVVVDFAHTPDGLEKVFTYGKTISPEGKLYSVFGSAGKRDKPKRKVMGKIASDFCENVFVTEDDPRGESVEGIANMIMEEMEPGKGIFVPDRYEAIKAAINKAEKGDVVFILGKGDEPYMYGLEGRYPWMGDNNAATKAIKEKLNK